WLMLFVGAVASLLLQSSTATLALVIGLVVSGTVSLAGALPLVLGANVGISITTLIFGWREAVSRRLGLGLVLIRLLPAIAGTGLLIAFGVPDALGTAPSWTIAAAHTVFNAVALLLGLALLGPVASLLEALIPDRAVGSDDDFTIDDRWVDEPTVAFAQTKREIGSIAARVSRMLDAFWIALKRQDEAACADLEAHERELDKHYRFIKHFLARQMTAELTTEQAVVRLAHLRFVSDLESVADIIERSLVPVVRKKIRRGVRFSDQGWGELAQFHEMVLENIELAAAAFMADDVDLANRLLRHKKKVRDVEIQLRVRHFERLRRGERDTLETTELHLEILSHLKRINDLVSGVAYAVLEKSGLHAHGLQLIDDARRGQVTAPLEVHST
ncbi:MAG: Na/Pi cotransporter family protein, partial [Phycisphaerales bacterium]|nr:Na/Pi cotransporter family protein [Phycisphaerales bacterium]